MDIFKNKSIKFHTLLVFIVYIVIAILFALPLVSNFNSDIPGGGDAFQVVSQPNNTSKIYTFDNPSETAKSLAHFLNPQRIFHFSTHLFFLHSIFGEPLAYNILWLSSFILAALGAYLLIRYLTNNKTASFIGGFIYGFSPIHYIFSTGFGGATHIEWIPFFILFLLKYINKPSIKNIILTGIFFVLIIANEPHFALYIVLFTIILLSYVFFSKPHLFKNKKFIITSTTAIIIIIIIFLIFYWGLIKTTFSEENYINPGIAQTEWNSADLFSFFTPSAIQIFWGDFFEQNIASQFTGNSAERTVYIGFIVLYLSSVALIYRKKSKDILFWGINAIFFSILALGPFLHFLGELKPKIPMPYLFFYHYIPFFENIRATGRIFIIASLCFSVVAAFGVKFFIERLKNRKILMPILSGIIFLILAIEFFPSLPTSAIAPPQFYKELNKEEGDFKIIQPLITTTYPYASMAHYYNSYHDKGFIGDEFSDIFVRPKEGALKFEKETPVVNELLHYLPFGEDKMNSRFIKHNYSEIGNFILSNQNNIKYLILDKDTIKDGGAYFKLRSFLNYKRFIENNFDAKIKFNDNKLLVFEIRKSNNTPLVLTLGENWNDIDYDVNDKQEGRWMSNNSTLVLTNHSGQPKKVKFEFTPFIPLPDQSEMFKKLNVSVNGILKGSYLIGPTQKKHILYLDNINPGENIIDFTVYNSNGEQIDTFQDMDNEKLNSTILVKEIIYFEINNIEIPNIYNAITSDKGQFGIIQVPIHSNFSFDTEYFRDKRINGKKIIEYDQLIDDIGIGDDDIPYYFIDRGRLHSLFPLMANRINFDEININFNIFNKDYFYKVGHNLLSKYSIQYLVIHKDYMGENGDLNYKAYMPHNIWNSKISFENEHLLVYRFVNPPYDPTIFELSLGDNWGPLLWWLNNQPEECVTQCRALNQNAIIKIFNNLNESQTGQLKFNVTGLEAKPVYLKTYMDNQEISQILINKVGQEVIINLDNINPGQNIIEFVVFDENNNLMENAGFLKIYNLFI